MVKLRWGFALMLLAGGFGLASCTGAPGAWPTPMLTLMPAYAPTAQSAQANAQATIVAGQALIAAASVQMTIAAATDQAAAQQTQVALAETQSADATATQASVQATTTAIAAAQATETRSAEQTATAIAYAQATTTQIAANQATGTAIAVAQATGTRAAVLQATDDHLRALAAQGTATALLRSTQREQDEANWGRAATAFWLFFWPVLTVLMVLGLVYAYVKLLPALNLWLRTRRGANGETILALDYRDKVNLILPARSFGPALLNRAEGVTTDGLAPDPQLQDRTTGRAQAVELANALPAGRKAAAQKLVAAANAPVPTARYRILSEAPVEDLLDQPAIDTIEGDWREAP